MILVPFRIPEGHPLLPVIPSFVAPSKRNLRTRFPVRYPPFARYLASVG
jgi:hypothetical protein